MILGDQAKKQELEKDIKELKQLIFQTENERVGEFLAAKLAQVKVQVEVIVSNSVKALQKAESPVSLPKKQQEFISIHKFAWEQVHSTGIIKIMINLPNIKTECSRSQILPTFTETSLTVKIHQYKNLNHIFSIPKLYSEIVPSQSSFELTTNYLNIKLKKKHDAEWTDVHWKKDIFADKEKKEEKNKWMSEQDKLMDMIKKVYQDGDPEMQKAIKEGLQMGEDKKRFGRF